MSTETQRVDVLAVIDVAATAISNLGGNVAYLLEARTAVAELIEADKEYDDSTSRYYHALHYETHDNFYEQRLASLKERSRRAGERRAAALARVGGAE